MDAGVSATMGDMSADPPSTQPPAIAGQAAEAGAAPDPAALLRSPSYLGLLVLGAITGVPVAVVAYFFLQAVAEAQNYVFTTLPRRSRLRRPAGMVADPAARTQRVARRPHDHASARRGRPQAGGGVQGRAVRSHRSSCPGIITRLVRHVEPRRRTWARGSIDHDRQRDGSARCAPDRTRCAGHGDNGDRRGRKLRSDRLTARISTRRRILAHGGSGTRWGDDGRRPGARVARRRCRVVDLRRARQLDRIRNVLARHPRHSGCRHADGRSVPVGDRDRGARGGARCGDHQIGPVLPADHRATHGVVDARGRHHHRRAQPDLRRRNRQDLGRCVVLRSGSNWAR